VTAALPLFDKDSIETGADGSVTLQFRGGRVVEVGPNARLSLGGDAKGAMLDMPQGYLLSRVPSAGQEGAGELTISTPFGMTRVGGNLSELTISVLGDTAKVDVRVGSVELISRNGKTLRATAGQVVDFASVGAEPKPVELRPLVMQVVVAGAGRAEVRRNGSSKWARLLGKPSALTSGDHVRVTRGVTRLFSEGSDSAFVLEPGSEVSYGSLQSGGAGDQANVELVKGAMNVALPLAKASHVDLGDATVESPQGGNFSVSKDRKGLTLEAATGDATVKAGELTQAVRAGQRLRLEDGKAAVEAAEIPPAALSLRKSQVVYHRGLGHMRLTWDGEPQQDYRVEVARTPKFDQPLLAGLVHQSALKVPVPAQGGLYWRIYRPGEATPFTEGNALFYPEQAQAELSRLRNEVPEGSETTTIYFQDKPPAVTFTYAADSKAQSYKVSVFREDALDHPVSERTYTTERAPLEAGILGEGKYVWSVTPLSAEGAPLKGGKMSKLEMVYDNSVPSLVVLSPKSGTAAARTVHASGVAPVGARVFVNDHPARLDEKHRFDADVAPVGVPPMVVFRCARGKSPDIVAVRTLKAR
jgi:hypothetical protein